ncbi:hypothetical protein AK812_SmicGene34020 [Symbiodinium microadriaticum]|uniref:Uncharacterized protein n=1 Tax=Symbiodinium microadriaticum TaxID=2951 RepID=A0A1Q9CQ47_SYMMI|nr:hypothetical protein AK812_SmicGene34020 [Symbiodinium microadriaticum]
MLLEPPMLTHLPSSLWTDLLELPAPRWVTFWEEFKQPEFLTRLPMCYLFPEEAGVLVQRETSVSLIASASDGSVLTLSAGSFAQVVREDFRFFPDSDADSYRYPPQFQPIDVRPRFMYSIGPLAFEHDYSAMYEQAEPTASAHPADSIDFEADGSPPAPDVDLPDLLRRFRSLDLRVRVLEAERSGAQQVDTLRTRLQTVASRLVLAPQASDAVPLPPVCLYRDPQPGRQKHLNRQELWAALQLKPIYRPDVEWTYWELLGDDVRVPPASFCDELVDAPKQPL